MILKNIAVVYASPELKNRAEKIAEKLNLLCLTSESPEKNNYSGLLLLTNQHLEFSLTAKDSAGAVYLDFLSGKTAYRRTHGGGRRQLLARAIGLHKKKNLTICDISAGLGRDAFILASLGATVTMVERSPIIGALLQDAWERAQEDEKIQRLSWKLVLSESRNYLSTLSENQRPEIIYFDPMFPERKKSALVQKEMRILREITGDDSDAPELLNAALKIALRRVVVKRPRLAEPIPGPSPTFKLEGQSSRFDIYLLN